MQVEISNQWTDNYFAGRNRKWRWVRSSKEENFTLVLLDPFSVTSQMLLAQRWCLQVKKQNFRNVWSCQSYCKPHGTATDWYGVMVKRWAARESRANGEYSTPVPLHPPRISHELTRIWTLGYAVRAQRVTVWTMTWSFISECRLLFSPNCRPSNRREITNPVEKEY
jgi:hypothetical protein